jgi:hypothetical protein
VLIRVHPTATGQHRAGAEYFTRVDGDGAVELIDGDGAVELIDGDAAPSVPGEMQATTLFTGGDFGARGGSWLFMVGLWTPADFRDEFVAWYRVEHMPILLECPLWDGCRFVETPAGGDTGGCQFYSLHQLNDRAALDSEQRQRARSTPWFHRLSKNDWFDGAFTRTLYRRPERTATHHQRE